MDNGEHIVTQLTYLEDQKLLTLRWRSVSESHSYRVSLSFVY
jgi:hypothetical protein